jgi:hypothetical protein
MTPADHECYFLGPLLAAPDPDARRRPKVALHAVPPYRYRSARRRNASRPALIASQAQIAPKT